MPPEHLQPKDDERGAEGCRPEHYAKRGKRLIPARREASQQLLNKVQLVHDLSEVVAGLGSLPKGESARGRGRSCLLRRGWATLISSVL